MLAQIADYPVFYGAFFWDVLIGNSVGISIIDSFSPSMINMLIMEGGCLLKTDELIGFRLNLLETT